VIRHAFDLARAKAARAFINRRAGQRIRRLEERLPYGVA